MTLFSTQLYSMTGLISLRVVPHRNRTNVSVEFDFSFFDFFVFFCFPHRNGQKKDKKIQSLCSPQSIESLPLSLCSPQSLHHWLSAHHTRSSIYHSVSADHRLKNIFFLKSFFSSSQISIQTATTKKNFTFSNPTFVSFRTCVEWKIVRKTQKTRSQISGTVSFRTVWSEP